MLFTPSAIKKPSQTRRLFKTRNPELIKQDGKTAAIFYYVLAALLIQVISQTRWVPYFLPWLLKYM
jgi:hypothetical protein